MNAFKPQSAIHTMNAYLPFWRCCKCQKVHLTKPTRCSAPFCGGLLFRLYPGGGV